MNHTRFEISKSQTELDSAIVEMVRADLTLFPSVVTQMAANRIGETMDEEGPPSQELLLAMTGLRDELAARLAQNQNTGDLSFGQQLSKLIEQSGLTEEDIVENFDVSFSTVERWKLGTSEPQLSLKTDVIEFLSQRSGSI